MARKKMSKEELENIKPSSLRGMDYAELRKTKRLGELRHDKDIVLSDIIQKLYKELWTTTGMETYLSDYHAISSVFARKLINEAKSMFYDHLRDIKSDIFLDCYNMMLVVAQKGMENEDFKLVLDTTKEIAKLHQLYNDENKKNDNVEQPLFSPPQRMKGIDKEDLYIETYYDNVDDDNDDVDDDNGDDNNDDNNNDDK